MEKVNDPTSIVLEKDSKLYSPSVLKYSIDNYWLYHRNSVDDIDEEKIQPAMKAW